MATWTRWVLGLGLAVLLTVVPFVYYRYSYTDMKRLRVVQPGVLYRSGQLSVDGFTRAVLRYRIRTIVNAQDEWPDPDVVGNWFNTGTIKESELCRQLGVNYVHLAPDLISRRRVPRDRPGAVDRFLEIMDDPANHPVLLHCRAGLHRTGVLAAVYRMEYQGWGQLQAIEEMKEHGFGAFFCTTANDYVTQYVLTFRPGVRKGKHLAESE
jgi:protein tyrosine/serine phosphatase